MVSFFRDKVREMDLRQRGVFAAQQAKILNVSYPAMINALSGKTWTNVNEVSPPVRIGGWTNRVL